MAHFTPAFSDFFRRLARNNRREWYHEHKQDYVTHVKGPFEEFVGEMIHRIGALEPGVRPLEPRDAIFRLARDTRFSKDKTPYKTHASAVIAPGGRRHMREAGLYLQFGAEGAAIAGGIYAPDKDVLRAIRERVVDHGAVLERLLRAQAFKTLFGELRGERNKRLPPELVEPAHRFPLIYYKQFYYWAEYRDPKVVLRSDLPTFVMKHFRAGKKINDFLNEAVRG